MARRRERQESGAGAGVTEGEQGSDDGGQSWRSRYGPIGKERSLCRWEAGAALPDSLEPIELEEAPVSRGGCELSAAEIDVLARMLASEAFATGRAPEVLSLRLAVRAGIESGHASRVGARGAVAYGRWEVVKTAEQNLWISCG